MPEENKVVIELEVQVKQLQKDLKKAQKDISKFSKDTTKGSEGILKVLGEIRDDLKKIAKSYKDVNTAAQQAGRTQVQTTKQATQEQKKLNTELKRTQELARGAGGGPEGGPGGGGPGSRFGKRAWNFVRHPFGGGPEGRGMGALGRGVFGAGAGVAGFMMGGMQRAHGAYMQYGAARYGMTGMGTPAQLAQMRRTGRSGVSLGFSPTETAQMAPGVAAATGNLGATGAAQQLALAGGFGPGRMGEAVGFMGTMRQAGQSFQGTENIKARQRDLSKTIAAGMHSGLEKARLPEFFAGVGGLVRSQFQTAAGKVDANVIAKQLAELGAAGGAGFQGARGAQVMGQLDAMIRKPGGGEAGQAMILQAMGFGKPGGKTNYYDALKMQQKGIREPENVRRVMDEVYRQYGVVEAGGSDKRNQEANLAMSTMSGLSLEQVETLKDIHASNMTNTEKQEKIEKILEDAQPIDKQALKVSRQGFAGIKKHLAGIEAMQIKIGAKNADFYMKLETMQLKALDYLTNWLPKIGSTLMDFYSEVSSFIETDIMGDPTKDFKEYLDRLQRIRGNMGYEDVKDMTLAQRTAYRDKQIRNERAQLEVMKKQLAKTPTSGGLMGIMSGKNVDDSRRLIRRIAEKGQTIARMEAAKTAEIEQLQQWGVRSGEKPSEAQAALAGIARQEARGGPRVSNMAKIRLGKKALSDQLQKEERRLPTTGQTFDVDPIKVEVVRKNVVPTPRVGGGARRNIKGQPRPSTAELDNY